MQAVAAQPLRKMTGTRGFPLYDSDMMRFPALALIGVTCFAHGAFAEQRFSDEMGIRMDLPDPPGWKEFKSGDPNTQIGRTRVDNAATFTLVAKLFPPNVQIPEMNEATARDIADSIAVPGEAKLAPERTTIEGVTAFRFNAIMPTDDGKPVHRTYLI